MWRIVPGSLRRQVLSSVDAGRHCALTQRTAPWSARYQQPAPPPSHSGCVGRPSSAILTPPTHLTDARAPRFVDALSLRKPSASRGVPCHELASNSDGRLSDHPHEIHRRLSTPQRRSGGIACLVLSPPLPDPKCGLVLANATPQPTRGTGCLIESEVAAQWTLMPEAANVSLRHCGPAPLNPAANCT